VLLSALLYAGLLTILAGAVCVIRPLRWMGIPTRRRAVLVMGTGAVTLLVAASWPVGSQRVAQLQARIDEWMPEWQFNEVHSLRVRAAPERVYQAVREVTADEIWLFRTLTWMRNPGRTARQKENILNPPEKKPILDVATAGGFRLAADEPPHEMVLLTVVLWDGRTRPAASDAAGIRETVMRAPGNAIAGINFRVHDDGNGWCTLSTETRVFATDDVARRAFTRYWRVIYPGSSLLRVMWLRAIRARAEM
jgi:hypothetical protein